MEDVLRFFVAFSERSESLLQDENSCLKIDTCGHGLRTPRESFFQNISIFWAWADILG